MASILIVDDMQTERTVLGKIVSDSGHQPLFAATGKEALVAAKQYKPALILLDVVMPELNGFNVCRDLKKDGETQKIPVVLVTSKSTDSDRFWGKKQGADDHIAKPFASADVERIIRQYVR